MVTHMDQAELSFAWDGTDHKSSTRTSIVVAKMIGRGPPL